MTKLRMINTTPITWNGSHSADFKRSFYIFANAHGIVDHVELYKLIRKVHMNALATWDDETPEGLYSLRGMSLDNRVDIYTALTEYHRDVRAYHQIIDADRSLDEIICGYETLRQWHVFLSKRHPILSRRGQHAMDALMFENDLIDLAKRYYAMVERKAAAFVCPPLQPQGDV
jgi:hypothetical protein